MARLCAAILLLAAFALVCNAVEDITFLNPAISIPPPSKEQLYRMQELREMDPWSQVRESDLELSEKTVPGEEDIEEETVHGDTVVKPKADLMDVSFEDLVPKIDNPKFANLRSSLEKMRRQLVPLHQALCKKDAKQCAQRRHLNAQIVQDIVSSQCYRRSCDLGRLIARRLSHRFHPSTHVTSHRRCHRVHRRRRCHTVHRCCKSGVCGLCTKGIHALRRAHRHFVYMHRVYTRLYIRYALTLSKYYRKKFKVLAKVFLRTVNRIRHHIIKVKAANSALEDQIAKIKADDAEFANRKASEHAAREKKMKELAAKHNDSVKKTAQTIADVKANIIGQKTKQEELRKAIADTKAKLAAAIAAHAKNLDASEKIAAEARDLGMKRDQLIKTLAELQQKLKDAEARITDLQNLIAGLRKQIDLLRQAVDAARAEGEKALNAKNAIQTRYNDLLRRYRDAIDQHAHGDLKNQINSLRAQLKNLVERCVADACGICGGDESSCANTRSRGSCYAVGDPHFRTYDGMAFDFQHDGQFLLAQHGQDFEIQNLQRLASAPWHPRLNKGIGMRCGSDVIIIYEAWGMNRALINGASTNLPSGKWTRVADGCAMYIGDANNAVFHYTFRGKVAKLTIQKAYWGYGNHMNLYFDIPWEWSSGRSMWGLCGDFDAWTGNDRIWMDRNWGSRFVVSGSGRDFFANPGRRDMVLLQVPNVGEIERQHTLDKANGVVQLSELELGDGSEMREQLANLVRGVGDGDDNSNDSGSDDDNNNSNDGGDDNVGDGTGEDTGEDSGDDADNKPKDNNAATTSSSPDVNDPAAGGGVETKIPMNGVSAKVIEKAKKHCGRVQKSPNSKILQQCIFDVINGVRGTAWIFGMANIEGHEKELQRCYRINNNQFSITTKESLKEESSEEGFSIAFWYKPKTLSTEESHIIERGTTDLAISQVGTSLKVSVGPNSCQCDDAFAVNHWTSVVVSIHRNKADAEVFLNRESCCKAPMDVEGVEFDKHFKKDIVIGGATGNVADGVVAHVFYVPSAITEKLAKVHGNVAPEECNP